MKRYYEGIREGLFLFSISSIKKWIAVVIVTCAFFTLLMGSWIDPLRQLFGVAHYIGYMFVTGIPFVVGASLLFSSSKTQNNIADSLRKGTKVSFASLFVPYVIMLLLMMIFIVTSGFVIIFSSLPFGWIPWSFFFLLIITLAVSLLVCPIAVFLALAVDDLRISTFFGIMLFLAIAWATGFPGYPVDYPTLAFLGPTHIISASLFIVIETMTGSTFCVSCYVGFDFMPGLLVLPIVILGTIGALTLVLAKQMFNSNLPRWVSERELWLSPKGDDKRWLKREERTSDEFQNKLKLKLAASYESLKRRRRIVASVFLITIILIPISGMGYVSMLNSEWTTVVYQTSGLNVEIGDWLYGEFTGLDAPDNIELLVGCRGTVAGGGSGSVRFNFKHRAMSLNEFLQLNDTELEDTFGRGWSENFGGTGEFHSSWSGPIRNQQYVWVLRFLEVYGLTEGSIEISFSIIIRAM